MRRINRVQRLARREEKDVVQRIVILSVISFVLIFVLLTVGITALGKFADILDIVFKPKDENIAQSSNLSPPNLNTIPLHVNNSNVKITGFSSLGDVIEIYLNGEKAGQSKIEAGKFEYELALDEGLNQITAKAVLGNESSEFSQTLEVNFDKIPPKLEVTTPVDGQSFFGNNRINVEGKTELDAQVFVSGFLANVDGDGKFDVTVPIPEGDSDLEVKALDDAGNSTVVSIRVNFRK